MATDEEMPATVRPEVSAVSTVPIPPGEGMKEPAAFAVRYVMDTVEKFSEPPMASSAVQNEPT